MTTPFDHIAARIAKTTYVILLKDNHDRLTLLADPGMSQPWHSRNKKLADYHAKECDGEARTFEDAWKLLLKANPHFEKQLHDRVKVAASQVQESLVSKPQQKQILDEHGRPVN